MMVSQIDYHLRHQGIDDIVMNIQDFIVIKYIGWVLNKEDRRLGKRIKDGTEILEVKQCNFSSKSISATFNDTNQEKCDAFKDKKLFLALGVWTNAIDLMFVVYGQNIGIGEKLEQLMTNRKYGSRSTQTISMQSLVDEYGFKIFIPPNKNINHIMQLISIKMPRFGLCRDIFVSYDEI